MAIGEIITGDDLRSLQAESAKNYTQRAYVAPTVFRIASSTATSWRYYKTLAAAVQQYNFLLNKPGVTSPAYAGSVSFSTAKTAQTLGINVDFYSYLPVAGWVNVPYGTLKSIYNKNLVLPFRFYKNDGSGPYYSVLINDALGISATALKNVSADKIAGLDEFHRQLQLLRGKYNTLAVYLNTLSKQNLNQVQQQSFNEGLLLLNNLKEDLRSINGVEFNYSSTGEISGIGFIPVLYLIIVAIIAAAAAWTIDKVTTERQKTARINASYDMQQWIAQQKLKIAAAAKAGVITSSDAAAQTSDLDDAAKAAQQIATTAGAETKGIFDKVQNIALIGLGIFAISKFVK